jgi:hypothetical protein
VGRRRKLLDYILSRRPDANIPFEQPRTLLRSLGFSESIKGSHHKFHREGIEELINLQEIEGGKCKPYQVRQMREVLVKYNLKQELCWTSPSTRSTSSGARRMAAISRTSPS